MGSLGFVHLGFTHPIHWNSTCQIFQVVFHTVTQLVLGPYNMILDRAQMQEKGINDEFIKAVLLSWTRLVIFRLPVWNCGIALIQTSKWYKKTQSSEFGCHYVI